MNKLKERVRQMLIKYPGTRKSDNMLMALLWDDDMDKLRMNNFDPAKFGKTLTYSHFLQWLMHGKLTNWESAVRVRRELQRKHPELRDDKTYEKRHKAAADYRDRYSSRYNFIGRK